MAVDPQHRYLNETRRADSDIYADFKLQKPFSIHGLYNNNSALYRPRLKKYILEL